MHFYDMNHHVLCALPRVLERPGDLTKRKTNTVLPFLWITSSERCYGTMWRACRQRSLRLTLFLSLDDETNR